MKDYGHYHSRATKDTSGGENFCFSYVRIKNQINQVKMFTFGMDGGVL